jgi:hypothetical protein
MRTFSGCGSGASVVGREEGVQATRAVSREPRREVDAMGRRRRRRRSRRRRRRRRRRDARGKGSLSAGQSLHRVATVVAVRTVRREALGAAAAATVAAVAVNALAA